MKNMKLYLAIYLLVGCAVLQGMAVTIEDTELPFVNAVLGKDITQGDTEYVITGYGVWTNAQGVAVEYGAIVNASEQARRTMAGVTAYLDGEPTTNITPLAEFCFGMKRSNEVVRLEFQPECWAGGIMSVGAAETAGSDTQVKVVYAANIPAGLQGSNLVMTVAYSLESLSLAAQEQSFATIWDFEGGTVKTYQDGKLVQTEAMLNEDDDVFSAWGFVRDENGAPVSGQEVKVAWEKTWMVSATESKGEDYSAVVTTDANGRFEKEIQGANGCKVHVTRPGYIGLYFPQERDRFPLDINLTPVPAGATNIGENLSWMVGQRKIEMKSLLACREVGLSLDTYRDDGDTYVKGWTTNHDEADVWFELGGTDAEFAEHFDRYISTNLTDEESLEWPLKITGLRGTQVKEAPDRPSPGMARDMQWTLCEADAIGYSNELNGLARLPEGVMMQHNWASKHVFSRNFYMCKDGRYGRLIGMEFRIYGEKPLNPPQNGKDREDMGATINFENLNMQTTNLNHRVLQRL